MSVKTCQYMSPLAQDPSRGPSQSIWGQMPTQDFDQDCGGGIGDGGQHFFEDFRDFPDYVLYNGERQLGRWDVWVGNNSGATVGTSADTTNLPLEGGVIGLYGGTTAIDITMQAGLAPMRFISPATGFALQPKIAFECRIAVGTIASAALDLFVGLMDSGWGGTHITSAASLCFSSTNTIKTTTGMGACLGFWKRATTNPSDVAVVYNVNNGTAQLPGSATNLQKLSLNYGPAGGQVLTAMTSTSGVAVANSFVKLGFVYDPGPSVPAAYAPAAITSNQTAGSLYRPMIRFYVNGQLASAYLTTADVQASTFPSTFLCPTIGYRSGGTSAGVGYVDWVRCAQFASF